MARLRREGGHEYFRTSRANDQPRLWPRSFPRRGRRGPARIGEVFQFKTLYRQLGVTRLDLKHNVRQHPDFIEAVAELGVVEWGRGVYHTGFAVQT